MNTKVSTFRPSAEAAPNQTETAAPTAQTQSPFGLNQAGPASEPDIMGQIEEVSAMPNGSIASFIQRGCQLLEAKASLGYGRWMEVFRSRKFPFSLRTAEMWMRIAEHDTLRNPAYHASLPPSLHALYQLSRADSATIRHGLRFGGITPTMTRAQAKAFVVAFMQAPHGTTRKKAPFSPQRRIAILNSLIMSECRRWPVKHRTQLALAVEDIANRILSETRKQQQPV
jgi:hypothetical protein